MHIDSKVIGVILALIGILQALKKLLEKTAFQWLLKKIFHWDEIPSWVNFLTVNILGVLILLSGFLQDGVLTFDEIMQILESLLGANGLFLMYKELKAKMEKKTK